MTQATITEELAGRGKSLGTKYHRAESPAPITPGGPLWALYRCEKGLHYHRLDETMPAAQVPARERCRKCWARS